MHGRVRPFDQLWIVLTGLVAILLSIAPLGVSTTTPVGPHWLFVILSFWCVRRPEAPAPLIVFGLGLLNDLLRAGPVGAELFSLLIVCEGLRGLSSMRPALNFRIEWIRVAAALLAFELLSWLLLVATYASATDIFLIVQRISLSILAYPIACYLLEKVFRARGRDGRSDGLPY
ncbi:MAG: rod shape-determining protein MreD [Neomegalonema sp.]|nr:rod shape-determining protein MreD [Neomegalonema sp.]